MCFYAGRSVGYKTLCVRWDATTGAATDAVCLLARERIEGTKGNERAKELRFRGIAPILFSPILANALRFCRATMVSRRAGLGIAILKNGDASYSRDEDDFHLAAPRLVAERNASP